MITKLSLPFFFALLIGAPWAIANHEATEPSDGTVASFIPLQPPQPVKPIAMLKDGQLPVDLSAYRGKVILLNLWATWCPPCIRELPALDRLQGRHGGDDFEVLAVAVDPRGYGAVKDFYDQLNLRQLDIFLATTDNVGQSFPLDVFPSSYFIDRQGRVISYLRSYADWDAPEADQLVLHYKASQ